MQTENETTGERTAYRYSVEGTLSSVRKGTGEAMTQVQENLYDHTGTRVQSTQGGATHTYCYADGRMLCDGTGSSAVYYLYAGDTVACGYQGEHAYLYMQDQQGSTYGIVREDGAVANTYRYTDFGETEAVTVTGFDNVLCYSGSVYDKVTGLYYLNARYYDPASANFLSQDTYRGETGDYDQWNLYAYCANDPVDHVDPSGHVRSKKKLIKQILKRYTRGVASGSSNNRIRYSISIYANAYLHAKGYELSRKMFNHALYGFGTPLPESVYKLMRKKLKDSAKFEESVCKTIRKKVKNPSLEFTGGDLHYSIQKAAYSVTSKKRVGTGYRVTVKMRDTYDFTEFRVPLKRVLSSSANDLGYILQKIGVVWPYKWKVKVRMTVKG